MNIEELVIIFHLSLEYLCVIKVGSGSYKSSKDSSLLLEKALVVDGRFYLSVDYLINT